MALTHDRANPYVNPSAFPGESYLVAEDAESFAGGLVALNASGYLTKAISGNTFAWRLRGTAHRRWTNANGENGAFSERVDRPEIVQGLQNFADDPVTQADVGLACFVEDDETIRKTNATNMRMSAGLVYKINPDGTVDIKLPQP
jgi:hypothetical protein